MLLEEHYTDVFNFYISVLRYKGVVSDYTHVFHYATLVWQTTTLVLQPTAASA